MLYPYDVKKCTFPGKQYSILISSYNFDRKTPEEREKPRGRVRKDFFYPLLLPSVSLFRSLISIKETIYLGRRRLELRSQGIKFFACNRFLSHYSPMLWKNPTPAFSLFCCFLSKYPGLSSSRMK